VAFFVYEQSTGVCFRCKPHPGGVPVWREGSGAYIETKTKIPPGLDCRNPYHQIRYLISTTSGEAEWTPFQTHYFSENLVAPGIEPGHLENLVASGIEPGPRDV
jgi:hypothetical protein